MRKSLKKLKNQTTSLALVSRILPKQPSLLRPIQLIMSQIKYLFLLWLNKIRLSFKKLMTKVNWWLVNLKNLLQLHFSLHSKLNKFHRRKRKNLRCNKIFFSESPTRFKVDQLLTWYKVDSGKVLVNPIQHQLQKRR